MTPDKRLLDAQQDAIDAMEARPTSPRTAAGRALLNEWEWEGTEESAAVILAIEAEAAAPADALLRALVQSAYLIRKRDPDCYCDESPHSDRCGSLVHDLAAARAYLEGRA